MFEFPFPYHEPLFRPPGEANSLIFQVTLGCSWNKCAFCEMYTSKKFKIRPFKALELEIEKASHFFPDIRKFFLADGNAMVLSSNKLLSIINSINYNFKQIQRISAYALPSDILSKSINELTELKNAGLKLLYIGIESGDNDVLKMVNKGETSQSTINGILKAHEAGIDTSCMIINGLGGKNFSKQHAINSAKIINRVKPKFLSMLTLGLPYGLQHFTKKINKNYKPLSVLDVLNELKLFISETKLKRTIFRSDHVSNLIPLKGTLNRNKTDFIRLIDDEILKIG